MYNEGGHMKNIEHLLWHLMKQRNIFCMKKYYSLSLCLAFRYFESQELESHALQVLRILHTVDEVTTYDFRYVGERIVRTDDVARRLLLTQNFLVALRAPYVHTIPSTYEI